MAKSAQRPEDGDPEIADAASLFHDETPDRPASTEASRDVSSHSDDVFDVVGADEDDAKPAPPPRPIPRPAPRAKPSPKETKEASERRTVEESARVDQVWSRGAEWGSTLVLLAIAGLVFAALIYFTFSVDHLGRSFLLVLVCGAVWVLLTYPIVITLERPVRMTPEQAVKDFHTAISHHFPHFRRMWLLLSSVGQSAPEFQSFPEFQQYWKARLAALRAGRVQGTTPLAFEVESFKAEKSAGKSYIEASYTISVYVRGKTEDGPIESVRVESSLVKGPDGMWYLNQGTLPSGKSAEPKVQADPEW
ncbi:MAG: hypothetical protein ABI353_09675 [Isosphaeraceae bacterium]